MKIIKKILIGLFVLIFLLVIGFMIVLNMYGTGSTTGGGTLHQPYYITPKPMVIKNIPLPKGTKLVYEFIYPKHTELDKPLEKRYIESIYLPEGQYINWGGIPINSFYKSDIGEYRIYPDFGRLNGMEETKFTRLWKRCYSGRLSISVKNIEDWSFSIENMNNITNCGSYYYNEGEQDRKFLDSLYIALKNANQPVELKKNP